MFGVPLFFIAGSPVFSTAEACFKDKGEVNSKRKATMLERNITAPDRCKGYCRDMVVELVGVNGGDGERMGTISYVCLFLVWLLVFQISGRLGCVNNNHQDEMLSNLLFRDIVDGCTRSLFPVGAEPSYCSYCSSQPCHFWQLYWQVIGHSQEITICVLERLGL